MKTVKLTIFLVFWISSLVAIGNPRSASGEDPADFYKGKVIEVMVCSRAGSSNDILGRALAPYLAKYTGATVVVRNKGGGGGLEGANHVWNSKRDGLTIGVMDLSSIISNDLQDQAGVLYEADKFGFLGSLAEEGTILFVGSKSPYKSLEDLKAKKGLKFAATSPSGMRGIMLMLLSHILDLDVKVVTGYKGGKDCDMSVIQMETDASGTVSGAYLRSLKQGLIRGIVAIDNRRLPGVPEIPPITELVALSEEKRELLELGLTFRPSKAVFVTPEVPKDRLAFLQEAYEQSVKDGDFRKELEKIMGYSDIAALSADEVSAITKRGKANEKAWQEKLEFLFEKYRARL